MLPILAGVFTAITFAIATLTSARASRIAGPTPTVAGVMFIGILVVLPIALLAMPLPVEPAVPAETLALATLAGISNMCGLLLAYAAYRVGAVGIVATIGSTEGAIAAVLSVLAGQTLAPGSGPALAVIVVGVVLAATSGGHEFEEGVPISRARSLRAAGLAACAACFFGLGLYLTGHVSATLPAAWVIMPGRLVSLAVVGCALVVMGRLHIPRSAVPFIVATGIAEVAGFGAFTIGAHDDIALTSVLASMFAPLAAVLAFVLFRERLAARQIVGIALVVVGIAILGVLAA